MAGTSAAIVLTSLLQWDVMKSQLKQNEAVLDQIRLESRSWLAVRRPTVALDLGKQIAWNVVIQNTGKTPALVESLKTLVVIRPLSVDFDPASVELTAERLSQISLAPGEDIRQPITARPELTPGVINSLVGDKKTHALYLVGQLQYKDAAGEKRITDFFFKYEPDTKDVRVQPMHNLML